MQDTRQAARALSQVGGGGIAGSLPERTLSDRLDAALSTITYQADRLEGVLSRVNGAPPSAQVSNKGANPVATAPLVSLVTVAEDLCDRLSALVEGVEKIA